MQQDLQHIVEDLTVRELNQEQHLIVRVGWILALLVSLAEFLGSDRQQFLSGDVVKGIQCEMATVLQGLPIFDLQLSIEDLLLNDFSLSHLDLFLPTSWAVEPLVVLAEVETSVVQTLVEVLHGYFLTGLLELGTAPTQLL